MNELIPMLRETRLRRQLCDHDRAAFEAVVRGQYLSVYRQLLALTGGDEPRAADLTQETFVAAWQSLSGFNGRAAIGTWLHTIAVRVWYRAMREQARRAGQVPLADALAELLADPNADPACGAATGAARATLDAAVNALPPAYRRAVVLFYHEEKQYTQIATAENIALGTVKSRLSTAIKILRDRLLHRKEEIL